MRGHIDDVVQVLGAFVVGVETGVALVVVAQFRRVVAAEKLFELIN